LSKIIKEAAYLKKKNSKVKKEETKRGRDAPLSF